jgi:hypothetical protein
MACRRFGLMAPDARGASFSSGVSAVTRKWQAKRDLGRSAYKSDGAGLGCSWDAGPSCGQVCNEQVVGSSIHDDEVGAKITRCSAALTLLQQPVDGQFLRGGGDIDLAVHNQRRHKFREIAVAVAR